MADIIIGVLPTVAPFIGVIVLLRIVDKYGKSIWATITRALGR